MRGIQNTQEDSTPQYAHTSLRSSVGGAGGGTYVGKGCKPTRQRLRSRLRRVNMRVNSACVMGPGRLRLSLASQRRTSNVLPAL
eukprot:scaffold11577_cov22-Tisochrysis_lutea.AAC.1